MQEVSFKGWAVSWLRHGLGVQRLRERRLAAAAVLTYHVVPGQIMSKDIAGKKAMVATVEGRKLSVDATSGVMVDKAKVVSADVMASNGVIHVIDTVVIPN